MKNTVLLTLGVLMCWQWISACSAAPAEPISQTEGREVIQTTATVTSQKPTATITIPTQTLNPSETPTLQVPTETPTSTQERKLITFSVQSDIQYGSSGNQVLDVYQPNIGEKKLPTIILFAGSGLTKFYMQATAEYFARQGYAVIAFNRRIGTYPSYEKDSFCTLAWVHANADEFGFDIKRIALVGFSLGGQLAAFVGTMDDPTPYLTDCPHQLPGEDYLQTIITVAGFFDYQIWVPGAKEDGIIYTYFGPPGEHSDEIQEASPISWVDGSEPPFLLIHGENDGTVDPVQSIEFAALLEEAGVEVLLLLQPNLIHDQILTSTKVLIPIKDYLAELFAE